MSNLTLISLPWELYQQGVPKSLIVKRLGKNRETIHLWLKRADILVAPALTAVYGRAFPVRAIARRFGGHVVLL